MAMNVAALAQDIRNLKENNNINMHQENKPNTENWYWWFYHINFDFLMKNLLIHQMTGQDLSLYSLTT